MIEHEHMAESSRKLWDSFKIRISRTVEINYGNLYNMAETSETYVMETYMKKFKFLENCRNEAWKPLEHGGNFWNIVETPRSYYGKMMIA